MNTNFEQTDTLLNGYKIIQNKNSFMFGIDAVLLSAFVKENVHFKTTDKIIDLGTGNAIIPLLLSSSADCKITGLEIQKEISDMAKRSIELNNLLNIQIINDDIKKVSNIFAKHSFNYVISNPPYMTADSGKENQTDAKSIARHEILCNLDDVISSADFLLQTHGSFFMIHRANRLTDILFTLRKYQLEPKILRLIHPYENQEPTMVLIEARKNAKADLKILPPLFVYNKENRKSDNNRIYSDEVIHIYNSFKQMHNSTKLN